MERKDEKRSLHFSFLMTPTEKGLIEELARLEGGLSRAALLRRLVYVAARERGLLSQQETTRERVAQ